MRIPFVNGVFADGSAKYRTSLPRNLVPVPKQTGLSEYYLRSADGMTLFGTGPGIDRGGINWNGVCYRAMGSRLVSVSVTGAVTDLGDITTDGNLVSMAYGTDRLCIVGNGRAYYWNGATLTQITDPDLGVPIDVVWADGRFIFTDGTHIIVTELTDPMSIDPLKYGSSEIDPDPIKGLLLFHNEVFAYNRHTIEAFQNTGSTGFPYQRVEGATVDRGVVGTFAKCNFGESMAFVGSAKNEAASVFVTVGGKAEKIATSEIDKILAKYTDGDLSQMVLEYRTDESHRLLYVHLPNETLVYDAAASEVLGAYTWHILSSGVDTQAKYRGRNFVYCYNKWICGDFYNSNIGILTADEFTQYGVVVGWQFDTQIGYNEGQGATAHSIEMVGNMGRAAFGQLPTAFLSWSNNGRLWSNERAISTGKFGEYDKRVIWRRLGVFRNMRIFRFRGANATPISIACLQAKMEPLNA